MKEIITANGVSYTVENVQTGINAISFTVINPAVSDIEAAFREVKKLAVGDTEGEVYGEYSDVEYESVTISADGRVMVMMHILTKTEKEIKELQAVTAEHDEVIAQMLYGGRK